MQERFYMYKYTPNYNNDVPSWDDILQNFEESIKNSELIKSNGDSFFVSHHADKMEKVKALMPKLKAVDAHLYVNFLPETKTFGKHKDTMDVAFWQVQGITKWVVEEDTFILKPGDLIYISKDTYHEVFPLTIRAGVSYGL